VGEDFGYTQPIGFADMTQFSYLTGWKAGGNGRVIVEGEAGNAYRGVTGPELKKLNNKLPDPVLKTFRRTAIWMPKEYILILDNIAANGAHTIMWRGTAQKSAIAGSKGSATTETGKEVGLQILSNREFQSTVDDKMALVGRYGDVPIQQLQASLNADAVKFATLLDPWKTNPEIKLTEKSGVVTLTVHTATHDDTWTWKEAKDATTPSQIEGKRGGALLISLTPADKAPTK